MMKKFADASDKYTQKLAEKEKHIENQNACNDRIAVVDDKLNNLIQKAKAEQDKKEEQK